MARSTLPLGCFFKPHGCIDIAIGESYISRMNYNAEKVDDLVLALLHLTSSSERGLVRAWKGHDWDALDRLHQKGLISDPKTKAKSIVLSDEGARKAKELFQTLCG